MTPVDKQYLNRLKKQREELQAELARVNKIIEAMEPVPMPIVDWKRRAVHCIEDFGIYSTTNEILNCILTREKMLDTVEEPMRRRFLVALSIALSDMSKDKLISRIQLPGIKGNYYGLKQWVDSDGEPMSRYMNNTLKSLYHERLATA